MLTWFFLYRNTCTQDFAVIIFQCVILNWNLNRTLIYNTIQYYTDLITIEACFYPLSERPISPNRICKTNRKCLCNQKVHSVSKDKKENAPSKKAVQLGQTIFVVEFCILNCHIIPISHFMTIFRNRRFIKTYSRSLVFPIKI